MSKKTKNKKNQNFTKTKKNTQVETKVSKPSKNEESSIKSQKDVKKLAYTILSGIALLIGVVSLGLFSYYLLKLNIFPIKYILIGYAILLILLLPILFILFKRKHYILKTIMIVLIIAMSSGCFYAGSYLKSTTDFLTKTENNYSKLSYSVVVLKESEYNSIEDLKDSTISLLDSTEIDNIKNNIHISYKESLASDFTTLVNDLLDKKIDAIVLESGYYTLAVEEIAGFEDSTKVIYTFEVQIKEDESSLENTDIAKEPFILYISGIDQRGKITSVRGRSDVNQLLVVNPKTHHILIVNTPRDYYVQLYGTTGLKDKLTHAGIYGIDKSIKTLETLYDTNIDHYLRVNFNTLEKLVDVIGGIDVYSDKSFYLTHNKGRYVIEGMNHFDGKDALAYSRERYAYLTGDNHRGANQQQVITAIIDKVTSSEVIIKKYNSILGVLDGTFQTDLSTKDITSLVKMQLEDMPKWTVDSIAVTGRGSSDYTYSMGYNYLLYVMEPNIDSVEKAKTKIKEVLNEF